MSTILIPLVIGASGIIAQIVLLRELLTSYCGNELVLGLVLGNWIIAEALGVFLIDRWFLRIRDSIYIFVLLEIVFSAAFFVGIYWARVFKGALGIPFGEGVAFFTVLLSSLGITLPAAFCHGALFNCGFKVAAIYAQDKKNTLGKFYSLETVGTCIGTIIFTYFFIPFLNSFQIASYCIVINLLLIVFILYIPLPKTEQIPSFAVMAVRTKYGAIIFLVVAVFTLGVSTYFQQRSLQLQYKGKEVIDSRNSRYGNITVIRDSSQFTFFSNGTPMITVPYPEISFIEEFGNLPLLFHAQPEDVLLIGRGAGGLLSEILKTPVKSVDYAELDPLLITMLLRYKTPLTERELQDPRVHLAYADGRFFVRTTSKKYDLVLLGVSSPADFTTNRLFTQEFFALTSRILKEHGVLSLWLPGSLSYYSQGLKDLNSSIIRALTVIYPYVRIIPGDYNIILASKDNRIMEVTAGVIAQRVHERGLGVNSFVPGYIEYRLDEVWGSWFENSLQGATLRTNRDLEPFAMFAMLGIWNKQFSSYAEQKIFGIFERLNLGVLIFVIAVLAFVVWLFSRRGAWIGKAALVYAIATTGFFGMLSSLIFLFCFQVFFGYLFHHLGVLIAVCMGGMAVGAIVTARILERIASAMRFLRVLEFLMIVFSGSTILVLTHAQNIFVLKYLYSILLLMIFFSGLLVGMEFTLAAALFSNRSQNTTRVVGLLYAADLFGGWVAGILGAAVLIPVMGMVKVSVVILMLKVSSFCILLTRES